MSGLNYFVLFVSIFILFNIFNTYFLTRSQLNRYIAPFKHKVLPEINAFLGNFSVLAWLSALVIFLTKDIDLIMLILLIISLLLNLLCFALSVFNLYYGTAFSKAGLDIFKNPSKGITKGMMQEVFKELFGYYRIILFLPTLILLILFLFKDNTLLNQTDLNYNSKYFIITLVILPIFLVFSGINFERLYVKTLPIQSVRSTYAIQSFGLYPYYFVHLFGWKHYLKIETILKLKTNQEVISSYQDINKNKENYFNPIDKKIYSNTLDLKHVNPKIVIDNELLVNPDLNGILKGKNLVLVQVESMNHFLNEIEDLKVTMPFLNSLYEESLVFTNFYTNVGIGVSSDAEVSVLTGRFPSGFSNLYWDGYNKKQDKYKYDHEITTLVKYFKNDGYFTKAFHGDDGSFYNRKNAYNDIIGFDSFEAREDIKDLKPYIKIAPYPLYVYPYKKGIYHISPWLSDIGLASRVRNEIHKTKDPFMFFPITMMPHTPFEFHPEPDRIILENQNKLNKITQKYINFSDYYDKIFKNFFLNEKGENEIDTNTVYLFYGDHGSGLKNGDLNVLFNRKERMSSEEERKHLLHVEALLYVPSKVIKNINGFPINEGLIKGVQDKVRGHIDIYRTIIELFGLNANNDFYVGANLLSDEETFVLDNKLLDVVLDNQFYSMRYIKKTFPSNMDIDKETFEYIKKVKLLNDLLYKDIKRLNKVNRFLNKENKNDGN